MNQEWDEIAGAHQRCPSYTATHSDAREIGPYCGRQLVGRGKTARRADVALLTRTNKTDGLPLHEERRVE